MKIAVNENGKLETANFVDMQKQMSGLCKDTLDKTFNQFDRDVFLLKYSKKYNLLPKRYIHLIFTISLNEYSPF